MYDLTLPWLKKDWQRKICLYFINRDYLKTVVKQEMREYPRILSVIKSLYKSVRLVYRRICK